MKSSTSNRAQLVGAQDGSVIVPVLDWSSFLEGKDIKQLLKQHQFTMSATNPGISGLHFDVVFIAV